MSKFKLKDENGNWVEIAKATQLLNKQDKLPTYINERYLYKNNNGELEWKEANSSVYNYTNIENDGVIWVTDDVTANVYVTCDEDSTISMSKDGITVDFTYDGEYYTANTNNYGLWTVTAEKDGEEVSKKLLIYDGIDYYMTLNVGEPQIANTTYL